MYGNATNDNKLLRKFAPKVDKAEVFHSSGYAAVDQGERLSVSSATLTMQQRKSIEEQRKYARGYANSRIVNSAHRVDRASKIIPRTEGGQGALFDSRSAKMYGRSEETPLGVSSISGTASQIRAKNPNIAPEIKPKF